jgi:hypothetical protein
MLFFNQYLMCYNIAFIWSDYWALRFCSSTYNIFWSYSSTCIIFWSCYYTPLIFFGPIPVPAHNSIWSCYYPPICFWSCYSPPFLVLLRPPVFGLITTPYFWSYYAPPIVHIKCRRFLPDPPPKILDHPFPLKVDPWPCMSCVIPLKMSNVIAYGANFSTI